MKARTEVLGVALAGLFAISLGIGSLISELASGATPPTTPVVHSVTPSPSASLTPAPSASFTPSPPSSVTAVTATVTVPGERTTVPGGTQTVTATVPGPTVRITVTATVTICPLPPGRHIGWHRCPKIGGSHDG